ncbi:membrane cofactor protein isoform X6 [Rhinolophus ferrumequinum]|uniref:membrane cofactor protein isoform X5 n=1 Tax=Rhinolophus ferrumequinum TaxID=59479 RepID=UPI00140FB380|nr:membrane cofactor protein isoform X5 [Rhinolophus ferrumequinum]XP_032948558.1 membrane cofactor protein isoform X6 [Rhinolophus ferrumequinum]
MGAQAEPELPADPDGLNPGRGYAPFPPGLYRSGTEGPPRSSPIVPARPRYVTAHATPTWDYTWHFLSLRIVASNNRTQKDACDDPPRFQSMKLKGASQATYNPGDKIEYECRPGYMRIVPLLTTTAVCQADNTWAPLQEACTRKPCPQLGDPLNGRVNGTFLFGSQAHFVCNEGFYILGSQILHCDLAGDNVAWDDEPPRCEKILCKPPGQIPNGKYTNSHKDTFEYNEVVIYSCNPSSGPDEYSLVGESKLICSGFDTWSSDLPECKVVRCPYPALRNGKLVSGFGKKFYYRATVVFECNPGYYLQGNDTIVCGADNMWEPKMPECIKVSTPPSTKPPTSSHSVSTPPSTKPPISTVSVHPTPSDESPPKAIDDLDGRLIAVIVLTVLVGIAVVGTCVYKFLHIRKKGEREVNASYSTYQNKSTTAEQTH